jgi:hypothetical protein
MARLELAHWKKATYPKNGPEEGISDAELPEQETRVVFAKLRKALLGLCSRSIPDSNHLADLFATRFSDGYFARIFGSEVSVVGVSKLAEPGVHLRRGEPGPEA